MVKHPNIAQLCETLETENLLYGGEAMPWQQPPEQKLGSKKLSERGAKTFSRQIMSAVGHPHGMELYTDIKSDCAIYNCSQNNGILR